MEWIMGIYKSKKYSKGGSQNLKKFHNKNTEKYIFDKFEYNFSEKPSMVLLL